MGKKILFVLLINLSLISIVSAGVLQYFDDSEVNRKKCEEKGGTYTIPENANDKLKKSVQCLDNKGMDLFQTSDSQVECLNLGGNYINREFMGRNYNIRKLYEGYCVNSGTKIQQALDLAYRMGVTKYNTVTGFNVMGLVTREQIAKMMVNFSSIQEFTGDVNCEFDDIIYTDPSLREFVISACEKGIMRGWDGKFHPKENVTYAQAVTMLMRIAEGQKNETPTRWSTYEESAVKKGFIAKIYKPSSFISRGVVISWMYNVRLTIDTINGYPN